MVDLNGKRILMFSPYGATRHYGIAIKNELELRGATVVGYDERPSQNALIKIVIRLFKKRIPQIFDKYIQKIINENKDKDFDYILICRGEAFTPYTITHLRKAFPNAKVVLYIWDILRTTDVSENIPYCDKAMSFDPQDVKDNSSLEFRPMFFVDNYASVVECVNSKNDVVFIGTLHSNRYKIINFIKEKLKDQGIGLFTYLYVPSILVYIKDFVRKFPYISIGEVHFTPISLEDTLSVLNESKVILDINYTAQKSLSTRAYEAMAAKRKYITTNSEVITYDFYNPQNIAVIDINEPIIPKAFLDSPFAEIPAEILYHYSVAGLIDNLFDSI